MQLTPFPYWIDVAVWFVFVAAWLGVLLTVVRPALVPRDPDES